MLILNATLQERLGEMQQGTDNRRLDGDEQNSGDDNHKRHLDSDAQAGEKDPVQSGL